MKADKDKAIRLARDAFAELDELRIQRAEIINAHEKAISKLEHQINIKLSQVSVAVSIAAEALES